MYVLGTRIENTECLYRYLCWNRGHRQHCEPRINIARHYDKEARHTFVIESAKSCQVVPSVIHLLVGLLLVLTPWLVAQPRPISFSQFPHDDKRSVESILLKISKYQPW